MSRSLALGSRTFTMEDLHHALSAATPQETDWEALKQELRENCLIFEERDTLPARLCLYPGLRAHLVDAELHLPSIDLPDIPVLNPTFHPLVYLRLFLTAVSGESYRVLSDDSFFFKPSARKLLAKFSTPISEVALRFLFQLTHRLDLVRIRAGKAQLSIETIFHLAFHEAQFIYFAYLLWSPLFPLLLALKRGSPQTWFLKSAVDDLIRARLPLLPVPSAIKRNPLLWQEDDVSAALTAQDLVYLGFCVERRIENTPYIQFNPWYHEWLFDHIPSLKRERHSNFQKKVVIQPNYEILLPPDLAWPSFLQIIALAKAERCDLVCHLRLTKTSVSNGVRSGIEPEEILPFFKHNAWSLPENVLKSLGEWSNGVPKAKPLKRLSAKSIIEEMDFESLRKEANHTLLTHPADLLDKERSKGKRSYIVWGHAFSQRQPSPTAARKTFSAESEIQTAEDLNRLRELLFFLEDCIRAKRECVIVHASREGRTRHRHILPLRIHRDGVSIYLEALCPETDLIRSFKLSHIIKVDPFIEP